MPLQQRKQIRYQLSRDTVQGEQGRDIQGALDSIPEVRLRKLTAVYTEPLTLGTFPKQPEGIELLRVVDMSAPEIPVLCGQSCHFVWQPQNGGAVVKSIDGMSVAANGGKRYRFTFRITYEAS